MSATIFKLGAKYLKPATGKLTEFLKGLGAKPVSKPKTKPVLIKTKKDLVSAGVVEDLKAAAAIAAGGSAGAAIPADVLVSPKQRKQRQNSGSIKRETTQSIPGKAKGGMFQVTKRGPSK